MSKYAFGVDVGGTTVKLGLFNDEGQVLDKWEIPTVKDNGGEKVLPDIAASIKNKMQEKNITAADLVGVGIGVMHYAGMSASDAAPQIRYDVVGFLASLAFAVGMAILMALSGLAYLGSQWGSGGSAANGSHAGRDELASAEARFTTLAEEL